MSASVARARGNRGGCRSRSPRDSPAGASAVRPSPRARRPRGCPGRCRTGRCAIEMVPGASAPRAPPCPECPAREHAQSSTSSGGTRTGRSHTICTSVLVNFTTSGERTSGAMPSKRGRQRYPVAVGDERREFVERDLGTAAHRGNRREIVGIPAREIAADREMRLERGQRGPGGIVEVARQCLKSL